MLAALSGTAECGTVKVREEEPYLDKKTPFVHIISTEERVRYAVSRAIHSMHCPYNGYKSRPRYNQGLMISTRNPLPLAY